MRFHAKRALTYFAVSMVVSVILFSSVNEDDFAYQGPPHRRKNVAQVSATRNISTPKLPEHRTPNYMRPMFIGGERNSSNYIWPNPLKPWDDRITAQIEFVPHSYTNNASQKPIKLIYVPGGLGETPSGTDKFVQDGCNVRSCSLTTDRSSARTAHARLLQSDAFMDPFVEKPDNQIWILWVLESPVNTVDYSGLKNYINWTATYRWDSTIVTPYEKYVPFSNASALLSQPLTKNYASGKSKLAAWFVSNCGASNQRWEFVQQLQQYMTVDIYGACGTMECYRNEKEKCNALLNRDYKFYLSFENSNCEYYITEKFFWNALWNDVVPVVMGARKQDYLAAAPPNSFIHVDDYASPKELAQYLQRLADNDDLYNSYFRWKSTGEFINTKFWCRLCSMLHAVDEPSTHVSTWYDSVHKWWRRPGVCTPASWTNTTRLL